MVRYWLLGASLLASCSPVVASARAWPGTFDGRAPLSDFDQDQAVQGTPRGDPTKWFSDLDYPFDAKRDGAQGSVSVVLSVDTTGYVTACRVIASSGNESLDRMTCSLLQRRARFNVQKDATGTAQPFSYEMTKVWKL